MELSNPWLVAVGLNTVLVAIAFLVPKKLLTPAGYIHAWFLGVTLWVTLGWQGYAIVMFYFLVGSGLTFVGMAQKEAEGIAEARSGARGPGNLWSSALTGTICAIASLFVGESWRGQRQDIFSSLLSLRGNSHPRIHATHTRRVTIRRIFQNHQMQRLG